MSRPSQPIALCAALPIPATDGAAPDWVHLLPAGEIRTADGRGPYRVVDPDGLIRSSLHGADVRLPLDENHSADLAAPKGNPSPARGWLVELQSRQDGIWGRVDWTSAGRRLVARREYRHISPAIRHNPDGSVTGILRASLVNRPNLIGLTALHQEDSGMDLLAKLRTMLGLKEDADEATVMEAIKAAIAKTSTHAERLGPIAEALGLKKDAEGGVVLQAVKDLRDPAKTAPAEAVVALQSELTGLKNTIARERAEGVVDAAIKAGKIAAPDKMRDHYIARHMADPKAVETELGAMVALHSRGGASAQPPKKGADGQPELDADEAKLVALMGVDRVAYQKNKAAQAEHEGAL